ncbi:hypothetical protein PG993_010647 [Apiospora rasikravindrae]|uniref:Uncharacterized protein n=1 Tax=Apiospora rasikravindrae TaxID=990691 RepID=A0ABR1SMX5_9PEZI
MSESNKPSATAGEPQEQGMNQGMEDLREKQKALEVTLAAISNNPISQFSSKANVEAFRAQVDHVLEETSTAQEKEREMWESERSQLKLEVERLQGLLAVNSGDDDDMIAFSRKELITFVEQAKNDVGGLERETIANKKELADKDKKLADKEAEVKTLKAQLAKKSQPGSSFAAGTKGQSRSDVLAQAGARKEAAQQAKLQKELDQANRMVETHETQIGELAAALHAVEQPRYTAEDVSCKFQNICEEMFNFCQQGLSPDLKMVGEGDELRGYLDMCQNSAQYLASPQLAPIFLCAVVWRFLFLYVIELGFDIWGDEIQKHKTEFYEWLAHQPEGGMDAEILNGVKHHVDGVLEQSVTTDMTVVDSLAGQLWKKLSTHILPDTVALNPERFKTLVRDAAKLSVMADMCGAKIAYLPRAFDHSVTMPFNDDEMRSVQMIRHDGKVDLYITPAVWFPSGNMVKGFVVS